MNTDGAGVLYWLYWVGGGLGVLASLAGGHEPRWAGGAVLVLAAMWCVQLVLAVSVSLCGRVVQKAWAGPG